LIREKNPFGETCGFTCAAEKLCQQNCYRKDFTGKPVNIAELQSWVCQEAGEDGWPQREPVDKDHTIAVIGCGPSAMSCAYYLTPAGCRVTIFAKESRPGGKLLEKAMAIPGFRQHSNGILRGSLLAASRFGQS